MFSQNNSFLSNPEFAQQAERKIQKQAMAKTWDSVYPNQFQRDQTFYARFISHPQHLPQGYHIYTTHNVENNPGEELKKCTKVLCTESLTTARVDPGTGQLITKPCFYCDLVDYIENDKKAELEHMMTQDQSLYEAYEKVIPFNCRTYVLPMVLLAKRVQMTRDGETYTEIIPDQNPLYCVMWISQSYGVNSTNLGGLVGQLQNFIAGTVNPTTRQSNIHDPYQGRWFQMMNPTRGSFVIGNLSEPSDINGLPGFQEAYAKYPKPREYGQITAYNKKPIARSWDFSKSLWSRSWWGVVLQQKYRIVEPLTWMDETPVFTPPNPHMQQSPGGVYLPPAPGFSPPGPPTMGGFTPPAPPPWNSPF